MSGRASMGAMRLLAAMLALSLAGCFGHAPASDYSALLKGKAHGYVSGQITGMAVESTLNKRDFVYAIEVDGQSQHVAFTHLAPRVYRLGLFGGVDLADAVNPPPLGDPEINSNEFDPEGIAWSPDGTQLAVASRDKSVRLFDAKGALLITAFTEEPLASVAWSPDGRFVVAGSEDGLVTVLWAKDLSFGFDVRAHRDSVRGLAFADDGTLWSGGWDKALHSYKIQPEPRQVGEVRLTPQKKVGMTVVHGLLNGKAPVLLTVDERSELVTLTPEAASKGGIDAAFLKEHLEQLTPGGTVELPVARDQTLLFKNLLVPHVDVAICGTCAPAGVDGILGKKFAERYALTLDEGTHEVVLRAKDLTGAPTLQIPVLVPGASYNLDGFVNDVTVSRDGKRLGVAINELRAERNLALYKREKAGDEEPIAPGNLAMILDAKTGAALEKHNQHHGIVASAAISPDGRSLASGGWDNQVYLYSGSDVPVGQASYGWCVRRVRFSPDGRLLAVGAWTPQNARDADSDPAAQLFSVTYQNPVVR